MKTCSAFLAVVVAVVEISMAAAPVWDSGQMKEALATPAGARAVSDKALVLSGAHALRMDSSCLPEQLEHFSISAWVRPDSLDQYNEIFRIEAPAGRVLFSFQEKGTVLALGLDVNGNYQECDAKIQSAALLDGCWHFVAATFDGKEQLVFLDGALAGRLSHAGTAKVARVPGFVGSSGGSNEYFHGGLDDLRLYTETLTPDAVASGFQAGVAQVMARNLAALPVEWKPLLQEQPTFGATLLEARNACQRLGGKCSPAVTTLFSMKLAAKFPKECANYTRLYQQAPAHFLTMPDLGVLKSAMTNQLARLLEYMPLTDLQWAHCPAEQRKQWQTLKAWTGRMAAAGSLAGESAAAAAMLLEAVSAEWPEVAERPSVFEPVAPYVQPATPEVKTLTAEEARTAIERDWLRQAGGHPDPAREIARTRALAERLGLTADGLDGVAAEMARAPLTPGKSTELYLAVRRIRRALMLANPVIDFSQLLLVDMPYPAGREWQHETRHRLGYMAVPGGQLLVVDGFSLDGKVRRLMPQLPLHGSFWRADLSFDAQRVLFSFKPHNEKSFHIYEIGVDGTGLRQITSGIYDDLDPVYLPDGKNFVFSSTRGHTYLSDEDIHAMDDPCFQGSDWLAIKPRLKSAPTVIRPGPFTANGESPP